MEFIPTAISEVVRIVPRVFTDHRGAFREQYRQNVFASAGITENFVQDNISTSKRGVLRGLHYQIQQAQSKLVTVLQGSIVDVAVDLRKDSATFGKYVSVLLSEQNKQLLYIPVGFAHGFQALEDDTVVSYKCSDYYLQSGERSLRWNDPQVGINWPLVDVNLSDKDKAAPLLKDIPESDLFNSSNPYLEQN
jgi:dTDP-4-dehydrorhamnose 3,5-epimerase